MSKIYNKLTDLIGRTPLLRLNNYENKNSLKAEIVAKLEYLNPAGSVKDRIAKAMIEEAEAKGLLKKDSVIYNRAYQRKHWDRSCFGGGVKRL